MKHLKLFRNIIFFLLIVAASFITSGKAFAAVCSDNDIMSCGFPIPSSKFDIANRLINGNHPGGPYHAYQDPATLSGAYSNIMKTFVASAEADAAMADFKAYNGTIVGGFLGVGGAGTGTYLQIRDSANNAVTLSDGSDKWYLGDGSGFNPLSAGRTKGAGYSYDVTGLQGEHYYVGGVNTRFAENSTSWVYIHLARTWDGDNRKSYVMGGNRYIPNFLVMKACGNVIYTGMRLGPNFSISKGLSGDIDANFDVKDSTDISTIFKITVANSGNAMDVQIRDDYAGQKFNKPATGPPSEYYWRPTGAADTVYNTTGFDFTTSPSELIWDTRYAPGSFGLPSVDIVYRATLKESVRSTYAGTLSDPSQTATITNTARIFWIDSYYHETSPAYNPGSGYTNRDDTQEVILRNSTPPVATTPSCQLNADPDNGQVPLSVDFSIVDPSGASFGSDVQFHFTFDDGSISNWGNIASINHTYVKARDTYNPTGKIKVGSTEYPCDNELTVTVDPWSEGNPIEVTP